MSTPEVLDNRPTCGVLGCTDPASARIEHPKHGERVVCDSHVLAYPVVEVIADG